MGLEAVEIRLAIRVMGYLGPGLFLVIMEWFGELER
jgi:hypothetical protein